jgi:hypothetical protein
MTPSRAFFDMGEFVFTRMSFITGIAHDATGCNHPR